VKQLGKKQNSLQSTEIALHKNYFSLFSFSVHLIFTDSVPDVQCFSFHSTHGSSLAIQPLKYDN